jgi:uncharacterized protein (DUF1501 family)
MPLQTRREFLATGIKGVGLVAATGFVPSFLTRTAQAAGAEKDSPILVVVQLSGGNDGLNTVVPFTDDLYFKARPTLGIRGKDTHKLNDSLGLHDRMKPLKAEFDEGRVAVIQNVGYPNPDRSHFRSMEIWHTGANKDERHEINGWLGRYFDAQCKGSDPKDDQGQIGVSFGKVMPQAFRNVSNVGLALDNPDTFQWNASGETVALAKAQESIFSKLNKPRGGHSMGGGRLANLGGISGNEAETLDFLRHTAMNAVLAGDRIRDVLAKYKTGPYPNSQLGSELRMISKLIGGNLPTKVYYASQGGFDTHANQSGSHARLLGDFSDSVAAFLKDMRDQKNHQRVIVMAFSEFGRRVEENGSGGTDHGTAAPMFVFGEKVKGGVHGAAPDLANLDGGDLRYRIDFREVYAPILEDWLETKSETVLNRKFNKLPILA